MVYRPWHQGQEFATDGGVDLSPAERPVHLYYRSNLDRAIQKQYLDLDLPMKLVGCSDWQDFTTMLQHFVPKSVGIHVELFEQSGITASEFVCMVESLVRLTMPGKKVHIGVDIDRTTKLGTVKALKLSGVCGIVPSVHDYPIAESCIALQQLQQGHAYWPPHILDQLPGNHTTVTQPSDTPIHLTDRQQQVFDLICNRGLSNKQIARALDLSESTVKIHVSAIMRAHGVRNRTQLALTGSTGLRA